MDEPLSLSSAANWHGKPLILKELAFSNVVEPRNRNSIFTVAFWFNRRIFTSKAAKVPSAIIFSMMADVKVIYLVVSKLNF
jgi:hypothetical protein